MSLRRRALRAAAHQREHDVRTAARAGEVAHLQGLPDVEPARYAKDRDAGLHNAWHIGWHNAKAGTARSRAT